MNFKPEKRTVQLHEGRCVYFSSDFHLGVPSMTKSRERERLIISWLESIEHNAQMIFLVGDIFDFWFEYNKAVPKGFVRLLGKLAELSDKGIKLVIFTGNHDMWMSGYLTDEIGATIFRNPVTYTFISGKSTKSILVGHGDGLGPGDNTYKVLKRIFENSFFQLMFRLMHPDVGIWIAMEWSKRSRRANDHKGEEHFLGEDHEWLFQYCLAVEKTNHHDYYIFGHRHLPLDMKVNDSSRYINLGEWLKQQHFAIFNGENLTLEKFDPSSVAITKN
ncbi:UDP-2,3-diacylglucosamine diphosphatase [Dyadobacter flavalbus]|uniref:UDP-2,3-diacylglucosamine diphosphatase n=1 Tax=Dyadobacter flavalbus TaxID=2579942 RepID=A0A5M8R2N7_9BACT|nr:UDP-2,3-diacylglucosamine diphosphatase [Dyadobacter flavalbus]KAA6441590.1 UDP-2,3-diacylglucosamine diphosphatase [Dyadobacter flavalbus]